VAPPIVVRAYDDVSPGFAHALEQQRTEFGLPTVGSRPPAHTASVEIAAARVLLLSARHLSYQDVLATVLASQTTVATGLTAASGWSPAAERGQPRSVAEALNALFSPQERGSWGAPPREDGSTVIESLQNTIGRIVRSGGRVAIGTDAPTVPYGAGLHAELARLAEAGIPNDQVLRLASAGGAIALGLAQQLGTLEAGKLADFVVLSGDPLARIGDTATIVAVVKGGNWHPRAALLTRPRP
jgi:imidazolonepropionase-like amidohydrolase